MHNWSHIQFHGLKHTRLPLPEDNRILISCTHTPIPFPHPQVCQLPNFLLTHIAIPTSAPLANTHKLPASPSSLYT